MIRPRGIGLLALLAPAAALAHDPAAEVAGLEARAPGFLDWVLLGVEHVVSGYDHLLFLAAIAVVATRLGDLALAITAFTVAHSITLGLAALEIVSLPPALVEPAIAASILFVAVENVLRRDPRRGRAALTFAFGLVHGFGFASVLAEQGVGAGGGALAALAGFNLGVEAGQLTVVLAALVPILLARRRRWFAPVAVPGASAAIGFFGAYWLVERAFAA
ncbi:MAG TPA: HupE/UreJ family protein [Vulgatibacter sp.]|nr:HupE/UreJ family protein [Vulgatibacter sp.]